MSGVADAVGLWQGRGAVGRMRGRAVDLWGGKAAGFGVGVVVEAVLIYRSKLTRVRPNSWT